MPFRNIQNMSLDDRQKLTKAYDAACALLEIDGNSPLTGELAIRIVALADGGERDPDKLCEMALRSLGKKVPGTG